MGHILGSIAQAVYLYGIQCYEFWKLLVFRARWRSRNGHNRTDAGNVFPMSKVTVGRGTYGKLNVRTFSNPEEKLTIGHYCSIAENVYFLLGGDHSYRKFTTYPFGRLVVDGPHEAVTKGPVTVEDDVWIGFGTIILSGVTVGKGSVIGAGSVVARDIPPYSVYAGGRVVRQRFPEEVIRVIQSLDFSALSEEWIRDHRDLLAGDLDLESAKKLVSLQKAGK